jgi:hypothetical protein
MKLQNCLLVIGLSYFLVIYVFYRDDELSFAKFNQCEPRNEISIPSSIDKIHNSFGNINSRGISSRSDLRFDRRLLSTDDSLFSFRLFRLKENDQFDFFTQNLLIQVGVQ